jgi:DSF synthase
MQPEGRPSFTSTLLTDVADMQQCIRRWFASSPQPFQYFVFGSSVRGIYNLGGDLAYFVDRIRARDAEGLRCYGYACVNATHDNAVAYDAPVVTIALVQGDALGGGFECALAFDVIVAERGAKFGLPEILFNLIPGMGAYSYLSRRLGITSAERMITSGRIYTAADMYEMGVVDLLCGDGEGETAVRDYIAKNAARHNAQRAIFAARRRVNPVPLKELHDIVDIWVEAALGLSEADLRKMERLTAAQDRRRGNSIAESGGGEVKPTPGPLSRRSITASLRLVPAPE